MDTKYNAAQFSALMAAVAVELAKLEGMACKFDQDRFEDGHTRQWGNLALADGLELHACQYQDGYNGNAKHRVRFTMQLPRNDKNGSRGMLRDYGAIPYNQTEPDISVSADGSPERIAKDVKRRLIEANALREKLAKVLSVQAERNAFQAGQHALARELFALAGEEIRPDELERDKSQRLRLYNFREGSGVNYGDMQINGPDSVKIELSVSASVAREFMAMLAKRREKAQA